jgi:hypothetical protein
MTALEKHILSLQEKVDQLNSEIRTLLAFTSLEPEAMHKSDQPNVNGKSSLSSNSSSIGINRYRQLRASD